MGKLMNTRSAQPIRELRPRVDDSPEAVGGSVYLRQQERTRAAFQSMCAADLCAADTLIL
jgi:hypothetical protein